MLMLAMFRLGVSLADLEQLDFGMMMDLIITHNNMNSNQEDDCVIDATQNDFDRF